MLHYSSLFHFTLWFQARDYSGTWISDCTADFQPAVLAQKQRQPAKLSTVPMTIRKKHRCFPFWHFFLLLLLFQLLPSRFFPPIHGGGGTVKV